MEPLHGLILLNFATSLNSQFNNSVLLITGKLMEPLHGFVLNLNAGWG